MSEKLFKKLLKFTQNNDSADELQKFVENLDNSDIISLVTTRLVTPDGANALKYLLLGLSQKSSSQKKRMVLVEAVLKEIQKRKELSNRIVFGLVFQIAIELEKFSTTHLIKLCNLSVDFIRSSTNESQSSWKELLPKLLNILETRKDVDLDGTEMSGLEYKKRIIQMICMFDWETSIITTLTAMFNELHLTGEQLSEVVNKLCRSIEELPANEVPPFIHQLLDLCKDYYANYVFLALRNYFNSKIYQHNKDNDPDSIDSDEVGSDNDEVINCESTVIYHIEEAAKIGHGSIVQLLRFAKTAINCPEFLVDPFFLAVLFAVSSICTYENEVLTLIKNVFIRNVTDQEKKIESAWLRSMITGRCDMKQIIIQLIESRVCENDKVMMGLINLGMSFLASSRRSGTQNPDCLWRLGEIILIYLVKKHKQVTGTVLKKIVDSIFGGQNVPQYTSCLRGICDSAAFTVMENLSHITRLVDLLSLIPGEDAEEVIIAIVPVVRFSSKLRDNLISVLRKALFHKETNTKKMAVTGFLKLLKYLKVKNLLNLSQSNSFSGYSGPSVLSQICADVHLSQTSQPSISNNSNEAICLEVVGVLRRCFVQRAEVKICFYEGLFEVVEYNPELGPNVLEILLNHFSEFYVSDQSVIPPINFSKSVVIQGADAVLQEPLGHLLLAIQRIVVKMKHNSEEENLSYENSILVEKFCKILTSLTKRFISCDMNHFELDEETNLLDILPECLQRQQIIYQTIAVYEALMAYTAFSWNSESTAQQGQTLESLFKGYNLLYEYIKNCKPNKKKDAQKKDKDKIDGKKPAAPAFKPPETILNLEAINRLLSILRCDVLEWATSKSRTDLRARRPLLRYVMQAAVEVVNHVSKKQYTSAKTYAHCYELGRILNTTCLNRYEQFKDFDLISAVSCIECFSELLSFIVRRKSKLPHFLKEIDNLKIESGLTKQLKPVVTKLQTILEDVVTDTDTVELYLKRECAAVVSCFATVSLQLPVDQSYTTLVTDYLFEFAQKKNIPFAPVTKAYIAHMLVMLLRCKTEVTCLSSMAVQICGIIGTHDDSREPEECQLNLSILNEASVFNALPLLCSSVINMLESVKWLLARLRSEIAVQDFPASLDSPTSSRNSRKRKEREIVQQTGLCVNIAQTVIMMAIPSGPCTETVFQMLSRVFMTLTDITKYFTACSTQQNPVFQEARFSRLVKLSSFHFAAEIPDFILHVEQSTIKDGEEKRENAIRLAKKQSLFIPRLTGDLETFTKCVTLLSNKCKDPQLASSVKLTTTRDFRVNVQKIEEIMNRNNNSLEDDPEEEADVSTTSDSASTQPRKKQRRS
ncbi:Fanconi anemia complementation group I [Lycorma delicatula]|uniref:Fanconi anemia complementation group I n=1 Tax=Lycorma delicatula TaxID=130591 RepID=UPI003F5191A7